MATSTTTTTARTRRPYGMIVTLILIGAAWASSVWWWPLARGWFFPEAPHEEHAAKGGKVEITSLVLSDEARQTLGIQTGVLKSTTYERVIPVPGRTIVVPGTGRQQITASASGVIETVFVSQGQLVAPNQSLFEVQLVHDDAVVTQTELLDSLANKEVVEAEVARLEELERRSPGAVPGTRLLEKRYELNRLRHMIASRRQMLVLLGFRADDVNALIKKYEAPDQGMSRERELESVLLNKVVISAPKGMGAAGGETRLLLEKLNVVTGQHVDTGDVLCQLGDYSTLWIEGEAFERDLETIRQARDNAWPITVTVERRGQAPLILKDLTIRDIAAQVDAAAGAADFYVELPNQLCTFPGAAGETDRIDWLFRPGQRVEIRVPVQLLPNVLKVPVAAVAEDGLNHYVFQVNGNNFTRRPVQVLERDENFVVIAENRYVTPGVRIALNGAFQLQLALLNKAVDPAAIAHGHSHG